MFGKFFGKSADRADTYFQKADRLFKRGRLPGALKCINKVLEVSPNDLPALNKKGGILVGMRHEKEGMACFERALELDPSYSEAIFSKGPLLTMLEKHEEAAQHYCTALEHRPNDPRLLTNLGNAYLRLGRKGEALECYKKAYRISGDTKLQASIKILDKQDDEDG